MKFTLTTALLVVALVACGELAEPLAPPGADYAPLAAKVPKAPPAPTDFDAEAAQVVVADLLTRLLPTLTAGTESSAVEHELVALDRMLDRAKTGSLRDQVEAVREALQAYGPGASAEEGPELEVIDLALDSIVENMAPADDTEPGRGGRK